MLDLIERASAGLSRLLLWFAGAGLVAMTGIIGWQVFARYVLSASPAWAEQAALVLMIWYITLAAAVGVREGFHIRIGLVQDNVGPKAARALRLICQLVVAAIGVALAVWGAELVARTWHHTIPTLGLPRGFAYVPLPVAGGLIVFFALEHIAADLAGRTVRPLWN